MTETALSEKHQQYGLPEKYLNSCVLGVGGMKEVLICTDKESRRRVAVAIPRLNTPGEYQKFLEEARLTARLEHPNIIPVHEVGTTQDGKPFFVMKLASGLTLAKILRKLREQDQDYLDRYPLENLLEIFLKICKAVEFAHSKNICHLDLKPENIQVGNFGEVLILDWGLAFEYDSNTPHPDPGKTQKVSRTAQTEDGLIKGTPEYMSPEQALGINSCRSPRSDIYSLGAILYSILTFQAPIGGKSRDEIIQNAADGKILPIRKEMTGGREIPEILLFIVFKAMNRAPSKRYQTVKELEQDINSYRHGYPTIAEKAGAFTKLLLYLKRERLQIFLMVALFFICFILLLSVLAKKHYEIEAQGVYETSVLDEGSGSK